LGSKRVAKAFSVAICYIENVNKSELCRVSSVVEQRFCKPLARGSNPLPGTNKIKDLLGFSSVKSSQKTGWEDYGKIEKLGENRMSELEWRERLEGAHKEMQEAMTELIINKNYSKAERLLHDVDKLMVDLIEDMGGNAIRSGLWT
jgi:hypothetical protein